MPNIHNNEDNLDIIEHLAALSRTTTGGISSGPTYAGTGIDLTNYFGSLTAIVSAGTVGTSLDGKWQESSDNSAFTDVSGGAITQLTAAGFAKKTVSVRAFTKRYVRFLLTHGGTCVDAVTIIGQKRKG